MVHPTQPPQTFVLSCADIDLSYSETPAGGTRFVPLVSTASFV